jgi:hypothetical protein
LQDIVYIWQPLVVHFERPLQNLETTHMGYFWSPLDS